MWTRHTDTVRPHKDVVAAMRSCADRVLLQLIVSYTGCPAWGSPVITPSAHATHANKRGPTHQCAFGLQTARERLISLHSKTNAFAKSSPIFRQLFSRRNVSILLLVEAHLMTPSIGQFPLDCRARSWPGGC